ncbi:DUF72 domain-containing protein [Fictibacillus barbaricus]|uniref:Uncharacterized protein YecE (DUF72 family) n=1 Tax=Fictibacillus barbaricus TaxID=182136 RepID=A0ABU1U0C5_9BACL|nr:DUF72 domain-containing protein [Fictibacillus barbaricus]MDR7072923.1 uncharacterized protein YecE (DUF72 family) [Fictibacillus barbaricus]
MIKIGVTGWGDHDSLYPDGTPAKDKLAVYSGHFPVVEVDSSFYAVQPLKNYEKWVSATPKDFSFVVKAYQGITGHSRGKIPFDSVKQMFEAFIQSIQPVIEAGKLEMVLFQYPPWFDCKKENVQILRFTKEMMGDIPAALEFRNQSWFTDDMTEKTLQFIDESGWFHTVCDEPQAGRRSIPIVMHTSEEKTLIRMHGRNIYGWENRGQPNWREVRYLYRYNQAELLEWKEKIQQLASETKELTILFNNNSGGDAADNAKQMIEMLNIQYDFLAPRQLDLF